MWNIIAIEGIDRIGKSTFIEKLIEHINENKYFVYSNQKYVVEKPTIGINTLKKIGYPLQDVPHIMELRNIGLFEELLFQAQENKKEDKFIIRDRFNLSELAYGISYRPGKFCYVFPEEKEPFLLYRKWNDWFEEELDKVAKVTLVTFVLDKNSYPNEDEAISASALVKVNEAFKELHEKSHFKNKLLIELHKDPETGMTDILDHIYDICWKVFGKVKYKEGKKRMWLYHDEVSKKVTLNFGNVYTYVGRYNKDGIFYTFIGDAIDPVDLFKILKESYDELYDGFLSDNRNYYRFPNGYMSITLLGAKWINYKIQELIYKKISDIDAIATPELPFPGPLDKDGLPF